tara:strand:- start:841 stop:1023 length:183 start_codon:yes stop_codon:yes gene_type:complete
MDYREGPAGTYLISRGRILPGTAMEANQARQNGREANRWMAPDYVLDLAKGTENQYIVIG